MPAPEKAAAGSASTGRPGYNRITAAAAQSGPFCNSNHIRRGQWIPDDSLKDGSGNSEPHASQQADDDARKPEVFNDISLARRIPSNEIFKNTGRADPYGSHPYGEVRHPDQQDE